MRRHHTVLTTVFCLSAAAASLVGDRVLHERCCSAPSARPSGASPTLADASLQPVRFAFAEPEDATLLASPASTVMCLRKAYGKPSPVLEASGGAADFGTVDDYADGNPAMDGAARRADAVAKVFGGDGAGTGAGGTAGGVPSGVQLAGIFGFSGGGGVGGGFGGFGGDAGAGAAAAGAAAPVAPGQGGGSSAGSTGAAGVPIAIAPTAPTVANAPAASLSLAGDGDAPAGPSRTATADPVVIAKVSGPTDQLRMPDITEFQPTGTLPTTTFDAPTQQVRASLAASQVPEPGSLALVLLGLGVVGLAAWRSAPRRPLAGA